VSLKRLLFLGFGAFVVFFIVQSPSEAAEVVKVTGEKLGEWLGATAESLVTFVKDLV
jgi:hypothetical protein